MIGYYYKNNPNYRNFEKVHHVVCNYFINNYSWYALITQITKLVIYVENNYNHSKEETPQHHTYCY